MMENSLSLRNANRRRLRLRPAQPPAQNKRCDFVDDLNSDSDFCQSHPKCKFHHFAAAAKYEQRISDFMSSMDVLEEDEDPIVHEAGSQTPCGDEYRPILTLQAAATHESRVWSILKD